MFWQCIFNHCQFREDVVKQHRQYTVKVNKMGEYTVNSEIFDTQ